MLSTERISTLSPYLPSFSLSLASLDHSVDYSLLCGFDRINQIILALLRSASLLPQHWLAGSSTPTRSGIKKHLVRIACRLDKVPLADQILRLPRGSIL